MPLKAKIDDQEIISLDFSKSKWLQLKKDVKAGKISVRHVCCDEAVVLKRSHRGLNFFAHLPKNRCNSKYSRVSIEHLELQSILFNALKSHGWIVNLEHRGNGWIADVYAEKEDRKYAFEVQLSSQTREKTLERQNKYKSDGIKGCWFVKKLPRGLEYFAEPIPIQELPIFLIKKTNNSFEVLLENHEPIDFLDFVNFLLEGKIKYRENLSFKKGKEQKVSVSIFQSVCSRCKKVIHKYYVDYDVYFQSDCGHSHDHYYGDPYTKFNNPIMFWHTVREAVYDYCSKNYKNLHIPQIQDYSKKNESFRGFSCPHCSKYVPYSSKEYQNKYAVWRISDLTFLTEEDFEVHHPHWCLPQKDNYC